MIRKLQVLNYLSLCLLLLANGNVFAQNMTLEWARNTGSADYENARSLVTDAAGNAYVTGFFMDTMDFDPGPGTYNMVSKGMMDIYILKLDAFGNFVWAKQIGGNNYSSLGPWFAPPDEAKAITLDAFGHVLICGIVGDTVDFDPGPDVFNLYLNGLWDAFVLQLDTAGNFVWVRSVGSGQYDYATDLVCDAAGNVYITGAFQGEVDFDPGPGISNLSADMDGFVLKLDINGDYVWASQLYGIDPELKGITVDTWGNTYVAGNSSIGAPPGAEWWGGGSALTVWKLDASGNVAWVYQPDDFGDPNDAPEDIVFDPAGNVYICGWSTGNIDFDPVHGQDSFFVVDGPSDMFILKLDTGANLIWAKMIGGSGNDQAFGIDLDQVGNVYVSGYFTDTVDFDPGPGQATLIANGAGDNGSDAFILKLDALGNYKWAYGTGGADFELGWDIAVGDRGAVYAAGEWGLFTETYTVDFDPGPDVVNLSANGYGDGFVQKFACNDTTSFLIMDTACESYTLNGETYTESGSYTQLRLNAAGCDSTIILELTIDEPDPIITVDEFILGTTLPYASYQWILNGTLISGATQATYTVTENGDYTVAVTSVHGCADTSAVYRVSNVGIGDVHGLASQVNVYPNPAQDLVFIQSPVAVDVSISSMDGRVIRTVSDAKSISVADLASGIYLLRILDKDGVLIKAEKLVKREQ